LFFPDVDCWNMFLKKGAHPRRNVFIPDKFKNVAEYKEIYLDGVYELMNIMMFELAFKYREKFVKMTEGSVSLDNPDCPHGHGQCGVFQVKKNTKNVGRSFYSCKKKECKYFVWMDEYKKPNNSTPSPQAKKRVSINQDSLQSTMRSIGVSFYHSCEYFKSNPEKRMKGKSTEPEGYFIKLNDKEKGTPYAKDDIWIVSSSETFDSKDGFVMICKSTYHSPTNGNILQVKPLYSKLSRDSCKNAFAIRGPNFSTEFEMIECLKSLNGSDLPLLYEILGDPKIDRKEVERVEYRPGEQLVIGNKGLCRKKDRIMLPTLEIGLDDKEIFDIASSFISQHNMNEDQAK
jgi:hypothetical protein